MHRTGGPSVLRVDNVPQPRPGRGEVLVEVSFAGVNPVDTKIRKGEFPMYRPRLPATLGRDVSGIIAAVGGRAGGGFKVGDDVFGMLDYDHGAYAEYAVASRKEIAVRPTGVPEKAAGGIGVAALTAWQCLFDHGRLRRGQRVLIHGAAGGVGHFAVQFAKAKGAYVVATASAADRRWVRKLGADEVIDFRAERFEDHTNNIDLVVDLVSGETQERSWCVLKPSGGRIVSTLSDPSKAEARKRRAKGIRMVVKPNHRQLVEIARLIEAGKVIVKVGKTFPLRSAAEAHRLVENGHVRGKVVLDLAPGWVDLQVSVARRGALPAERLGALAPEDLVGVPSLF
jgi:NADPH:quinone reductase-like Zn-dependent oxidoreductase